MRSITWSAHRSFQKSYVAIFWPRIIYSLYNFYGVTMTIKGSLYKSTPMLKPLSVAKKLQSKSEPKMTFLKGFYAKYVKRRCSGQVCAFWRSRWWYLIFRSLNFRKKSHFGHAKLSYICGRIWRFKCRQVRQIKPTQLAFGRTIK